MCEFAALLVGAACADPEPRTTSSVVDDAPPGHPHVALRDGTRLLALAMPRVADSDGALTVESWTRSDVGPSRQQIEVVLAKVVDGERAIQAWVMPDVPAPTGWEPGAIVHHRHQIRLPWLREGRWQIRWRVRDRASDRLVSIVDFPYDEVPAGVVSIGVDEPPRHAPPSTDPIARVAAGGDTSLGRRMNLMVATRPPDWTLGDLRLDQWDLAWLNLESVATDGGELGFAKGEPSPYYLRARSSTLDTLRAGGVDVVNTANNHAGDYGPSGLLDQMRLLDAMRIAQAGSGPTFDEACSPVYRHAGPLVVAFFGLDGTQPSSAAGPDQAGHCYLPPEDPERWRQVLEPRIAAARDRAHVVLVGVHWGRNRQARPTPETVALGHAIIDAGADAIVGSSSHWTQGIEIYDGRPILYDTGNVLFDVNMKDEGANSNIFSLELGPFGVERIELIPIWAAYARALRTRGNRRPQILLRQRDLSAELGTHVDIDARHGVVHLPPPLERPGPTVAVPPNPVVVPPPVPTEAPEQCRADTVPEDARIEPVQFGPFTLHGLRIEPHSVDERQLAWIEGWWSVSEPVGAPHQLYVRFEPQDGDGSGWFGDHEPCDWVWPTNRWQPGQLIHDRSNVRPGRWRTGDYDVVVGVRDLEPDHGPKRVLGMFTVE